MTTNDEPRPEGSLATRDFWDGLSKLDVALKVAWIAVRVLAAIALMAKGSYFFYQGF